MSLDAIVWLVVGIGVGVGACLMLLILYAGVERWRLGRRLRRARALKGAASPAPTVRAQAPAGSKLALLDQKKARQDNAPAKAMQPAPARKPGAELATKIEPVAGREAQPPKLDVPEPKPETVPAKSEPVSRPAPALTVVRTEPQKAPAANAAPAVATAEPEPAETPAMPVPAVEAKPVDAAPAPPKPQSVEDMFAEAFALDKVAVAPLKTEKDDAG